MSRYRFCPIIQAPKGRGQTLVLADDTGWMAVGHWTGNMWAIGRHDQPGVREELEFEPTKFALPKSQPHQDHTLSGEEREG